MGEKLLSGKTALVTGAGGGIGRASALLFGRHGARVAVVDVDGPRAPAAADRIRDEGGEARFIEADVERAEDVAAAVTRAVAEWEGLDVVFNVAGSSGRRWGDGPVAECTEEAWDRVMRLNLKSVFLFCKFAVPHMVRAGGGSIVNLSSVLALAYPS